MTMDMGGYLRERVVMITMLLATAVQGGISGWNEWRTWGRYSEGHTGQGLGLRFRLTITAGLQLRLRLRVGGMGQEVGN